MFRTWLTWLLFTWIQQINSNFSVLALKSKFQVIRVKCTKTIQEFYTCCWLKQNYSFEFVLKISTHDYYWCEYNNNLFTNSDESYKGIVKTSTRTNGNKTENFQVKLSTTSKSKICEGKSKYSLRKVVIAWSILSKSALCPMDHFNIKMYSKSTAEN